MNTIRVALGQINSTVGDFAGNTARIAAGIERAIDAGADLVAFPELALCGYPPEDLTFNPDFLAANRRALEELVKFKERAASVNPSCLAILAKSA